MAKKKTSRRYGILPCIVAAIIAIAGVWTIIDQTKTGIAVSAFQTPISIFPLLWMGKRLTQRQRPRSSSPHHHHPSMPILPPLVTRLKSIVENQVTKKNNDNDNVNIDKLTTWLDSFEGHVSNVKVDANAHTGLRGLYATKDMKKNQLLIEVPYDAALMVGDTLWQTMYDDFSHIPESDSWEEEDIDDVYQGLNLLEAFVQHDEWSSYVCNLPSKPTNGDSEMGVTPDFWSESIIHQLGVPSYTKAILDRKHIVAEVARQNNVNENDLRWATWMVRSRRFTTWNMVNDPSPDDEDGSDSDSSSLFGAFPIRSPFEKKIEQIQGFLIPLIDMANHDFTPNAEMKISVNRWTREFDDTSTFALRALRPIAKGEEVTLEYGDGDRTSLIFLEKYGFFLEGNEADKEIDWDGDENFRTEFTTSLEDDEAELAALNSVNDGDNDESNTNTARVLSKTTSKIKTIVSKIQDYEPNFALTLDDGLELVGSGVRQKVGIKIYAVAMYASSAVLGAAAKSPSSEKLRTAVRDFGDLSPRITFVLEMILQADAETIAEAIAESVKLRYFGSKADVQYLETLISEGVKESGDQATKGSTLQFDCTDEGVSVSIDGAKQGTAKFSGLGSSFVDVFMDENTVSPSLVDDCLKRCNSEEEGGPKDDTSAAPGEGVSSESRKTMLSLRILMKKLSGWILPAPTVDAGAVNSGIEESEDQKESPEFEQQSIIDPVSDDSVADVDANKTSGTEALAGADEQIEIDGTEPLGKLIDTSDSETVSDPEPLAIVEAAKEPDAIATPLPDDILSDPSTFDAGVVEARIRQLETEIEAEIARVKSQGMQPRGLVDPAQQGSSEEQGTALINEATASLEAEDKQSELAVAAAVKEEARQQAAKEASEQAAAQSQQTIEAVESKMKSIKDKATGVSFNPKLQDGLYLVGVGVRKKAIINVYSVAAYSSPSVLETLSAFPRGEQSQEAKMALKNAARTFDETSPTTTFVLEMVFKADAATIAGAIAEGVKPRYSGPAADVKELENLIIQGVKSKGGQATKGTIFRFDCTTGGVRVSVDGNEQGMASFNGMGSSLVDVFLDEKAVSPQLISSCLDSWSGSGL